VTGYPLNPGNSIAEKLSFEAARAKSQPVAAANSDTTPLVELIANAVERFDIEPATPRPQDFARETEVVGSLAGFLTVALPRATIDLEPRFGGSVSVRPDMVVSMGHSACFCRSNVLRQFVALRHQYLAQMAHCIGVSALKRRLSTFTRRTVGATRSGRIGSYRASGLGSP